MCSTKSFSIKINAIITTIPRTILSKPVRFSWNVPPFTIYRYHIYKDKTKEITLLDILGTERDEIVDLVQMKIEKKRIMNHLHILDDREQDVIRNRFGLDGLEERTQREIAKKLGISRSYVSRIEKRALIKLFHEFYRKPWKRQQ
jgi:RNA polymerase sporulation-specific sigma factor